MARIRTIKPQHVNDKELVNISLQAHLFWVLSWCFSDDEGVLENDALLLKSQIFPRRTDIRLEQVQQWIDQLVKARFMVPFTHNGEGYLLHRTFKTHQRIDKPQPSKIPSEIILRTIQEHSKNDPLCIVEDSTVKERKGEPREDLISDYPVWIRMQENRLRYDQLHRTAKSAGWKDADIGHKLTALHYKLGTRDPSDTTKFGNRVMHYPNTATKLHNWFLSIFSEPPTAYDTKPKPTETQTNVYDGDFFKKRA